MTAFVLVHGAMHGSWCWELMTPRLKAQGHQVITIDLPGAKREIAPEDVTMGSWRQSILQALNLVEEKAVLVGHSMGGLPVSVAAEAAPHRIRALVYLCARVPMNETLSTGDAFEAIRAQLMSEDGGKSIYFPEHIAREFFYWDCPQEIAAKAIARLTPQPTRPLRERLSFSDHGVCSVARHYILTTADRAISPDIQRGYIASNPGMKTHSLNCGHSPFYSHPDELTALLVAIARDGNSASPV